MTELSMVVVHGLSLDGSFTFLLLYITMASSIRALLFLMYGLTGTAFIDGFLPFEFPSIDSIYS